MVVPNETLCNTATREAFEDCSKTNRTRYGTGASSGGRDGDAGDNVDVERRGIRVKGTDIGVGFARIVHVQTAGATGNKC